MTTWSDKAVTAALQKWFVIETKYSQFLPVHLDRMRACLEAAQEEMVAEGMAAAIGHTVGAPFLVLDTDKPITLAEAIPILEAELDRMSPGSRIAARVVIDEAKGLLVDIVYHGEAPGRYIQVTVSHVDEASFTLPLKVSARQRKVLIALHENADFNPDYAYYTATIANWAALSEHQTRCALRALVRKGLAELVRGLMDENDGLLKGSGYRLTDVGRKIAAEMSRPKAKREARK